eukprot:TRINITY_DN3098_c0_g1_i1.p1 TRINITY_DN3098_c0_g1~~TRINITY_DN3098_c0_g1_i1.p1  ORF type:complete len:277 (-),score=41.44 TRINITY_DN3098_c0_g1_i1:745-1575(-)
MKRSYSHLPKSPSISFPLVLLPDTYAQWNNILRFLRQPIQNYYDLVSLLSELVRCTSGGSISITLGFFNSLDEEEKQMFFQRILPFMQELVLDLPLIFPERHKLIHLTHHSSNTFVRLTRKQVACLIACGFFGLIKPDRGYPGPVEMWPGFRFWELFNFDRDSSMGQFAFCIYSYFDQLCRNSFREGDIIIWRKSSKGENPITCTLPISKIRRTDQLIEACTDVPFHADFANKYLGGGFYRGKSRCPTWRLCARRDFIRHQTRMSRFPLDMQCHGG